MFWPALLFVGQLWLGEVTRKRPKRVSWEEFLESNEPSEIRPIPYVGGTIEITPSRIWYGDFKQRAVERDSHWTDYLWAGALAFLLDTITVAYRYYIGEAFAICYGPERHVQRITIEDRPVYAAGLEFDNAGSGFLIDDPQAWGGDQPPGEGGQYSHCVLTRGNYTDAANVYLQQMLASGANKVPSLRGITSLISYGPSNTGVPESGYFAAGGVGYTPRLKEWKVVVRAQPDNLATGFNKIGRHMNPMEVIYEWSTSMEYGARVPDIELNLSNWRTLAETLHTENNGWSGKIEGQTSPGEVVRDVLAQIDAVPDFSPSLGMGFRLIRRDYSFGSLRVLDKSVITRVDEFTPGTYEDTVNKVQVEFPEDQDNNFKPRKALYIDPANQQIQGGRVVPQTVGYLGVADFEQANVISTRLGRAQSLPRAPLECSVFPSWGRLTYVGEVALFEWSSPSLSIVMRVLKITPNGPDDQDYRLVLMEDQFSTGLRTFGEPAGERHDDPAAGLSTAPPSAIWDTATFPPDGLIFTLQTANTNEFLATITGGVIFGAYTPGGQYARIWVTEPGGVQTLSPLRLAPDTNNEATFTWPALAAGTYQFCVQTFSLRDATNGVKVCADIAIAEIGSPSPSPSASLSPSASVSSSPSPSGSISPSSSTSPSISPTPSSSVSPSASLSPSSSASPSAAASPHQILFMANGEIESGEGQIFSSVGNNTPPDSGVTGAHGLVYDQAAVSKSISFPATQTFSHHVRYYFRVDSDSRDFLLVQDGGATTHLTLTWRTGGVVEVKRSATVLGTVTGLTLSLNTWYEVNFYGLIDDTTGEWTLEIDGVVPNRSEGGTMQQTGVDTRNGGAAAQTSSAGYGEPNLDTYIDDVVVSATNASLGTGEVETLMPSADGFYTALTPNTGSNHFDRVNEKPLSESTFVTSSGASQRDSYAFENRSVSGSVVAVALFWRGRLDAGTPTITPFFRIGGVDFDGTAQATTSSFVYYREIFDNNPATGFEWEDAEIDALEAGPLCSTATARIAQFAMQVYVRTS